MLGLGLRLALAGGGVSGPSYSAEATALFARMTTAPSDARKLSIDTLITSLKTAGVWTKLDALYILAAHASQAARLNWVQDLYNCTAINSPTFTTDRGYTGDGSSSYLDTNFNPTTASTPKLTQNDAHLGLWSRTSAGSFVNDMGAAATLYLGARNNGLTDSRICSAGSTGIASADGTGHFTGARSGSAGANSIAYRNGASIGSPGGTSGALTSGNIFVGARSINAQFSARQIAAAHYGSNLTAQNVSDLYAALSTYMTSVGA